MVFRLGRILPGSSRPSAVMDRSTPRPTSDDRSGPWPTIATDAFDGLQMAAIVVGPEGAVNSLNETAARVILRSDALVICNGRLCCRDEVSDQVLRDLIQGVCGAQFETTQSLEVGRERGAEAMIVSVLPAPSRAGRAALVVFYDPGPVDRASGWMDSFFSRRQTARAVGATPSPIRA